MRPGQLAAGDLEVAGHARAGREHDGVELRAQLLAGDVDADLDAEAQLDALGEQLVDAALHDPLLDLEVGDAEADEAARRLVALEEHDARVRRGAAAAPRPARRARADDRHPAAGLVRGRLGATQPSSKPRLMIEFSICLIVTASPSLISSTHAASHGAGHSRPVNSGKLFV